VRRLDEEMIVVVHQALGVAEPAVAIDDMGQEGEPLGPIAVIVHDVLPGIAPTGDVVDGAGEFKAKRTRPILLILSAERFRSTACIG
jgi:hypothetical protein